MTPDSPRLAALLAQVAARDGSTLAAFWEEMSVSGTPLIEPAGDADTALVTLVVRADDADAPHYVAGLGLGGLDPQDRLMRTLDGTDVRYRSYRVPADLRTVYAFARTPEADVGPEDLVADPLAPRAYVYPADEEDPDDREVRVTLLELPGAAAPRWSAPDDAPPGDVELHRFESGALGGERRVYTYLPASFDASAGPYPLLILIDGWAFTRVVSAPTVLDNLIRDGAIPPLIAVMPDSPTTAARMSDLWLSSAFNAFLADELLPWARLRWPLTTDPSQVVIAGSSLGGIAAAYFAVEHPDLAGGVISMSGTFQISPADDPEPVWLARVLAGRPMQPLRFWLNVGLLERHPMPVDVSNLAANRSMRDVLRARGYPVAYHEFPGGHDYFWWVESLGDGLIDLVGATATVARP